MIQRTAAITFNQITKNDNQNIYLILNYVSTALGASAEYRAPNCKKRIVTKYNVVVLLGA